jgi:hypothetical protein
LATVAFLMLALGIYLLEFLFAAGIVGCAIVVVLVAIDDIREVTKKDEEA